MFALTLVLSASFTPLFTDEISTHIPNGRWVRDGYVLSNNLAACGIKASEQPAAFFSLPFLWVESAIHELIGRPGWIRFRSLITMFAWLLLVSRLLPRSMEAQNIDRTSLRALGAAFLSIGVLPVMLVFARPEVYMLFGLSLFLLVPLAQNSSELNGRSRQILLSLLWIFITALMFTYHFKAAFFLPLIWVSVWMTIGGRWLKSAVLTLVTLIALMGVQTWSNRLVGCQDPGVMNFITSHMLPVTKLLFDPQALVRALAARLLDFPVISPHPYFANAMVWQTYAAEWLYHPDQRLLRYLVNGIALAAFAVLITSLLWSASAAIGAIVRKRHLERRQLLMLCMLASVASLSFMQGTKHYYETILVLPLLALTALACPPTLPSAWSATAIAPANLWRWSLSTCFLAAIVSQLALYALYAPMVPVTLSGKVVYEKQHFSMSAYNYSAIEQDTREAARLCEIDLNQRQSHLVIDDMTYLAVRKSAYRPLHGLFLYYWWFDPKKRRDATILPYHPAGALLSCNHVFPEFKGKERRSGGVCCISGSDMQPPN
jgi:hypothetical protein